MATKLEVAQHLRGLQLNILDYDQVTVVEKATGTVMVNLHCKPEGFNLIHHDNSITRRQALSMAVLALIAEVDSLAFAELNE